MRLYVHYYGLTTDRLYTLVFMGWLGSVLVLLAATVLRGRGRLFVAGSAASALVLLARAATSSSPTSSWRAWTSGAPRARRARPTPRSTSVTSRA